VFFVLQFDLLLLRYFITSGIRAEGFKIDSCPGRLSAALLGQHHAASSIGSTMRHHAASSTSKPGLWFVRSDLQDRYIIRCVVHRLWRFTFLETIRSPRSAAPSYGCSSTASSDLYFRCSPDSPRSHAVPSVSKARQVNRSVRYNLISIHRCMLPQVGFNSVQRSCAWIKAEYQIDLKQAQTCDVLDQQHRSTHGSSPEENQAFAPIT
jgi:hypothetical protein